MKVIPIALFIVTILASPAAEAAGPDRETCHKAVASKGTCRWSRPNSPMRTACVKAAIQRCREWAECDLN